MPENDNKTKKIKKQASQLVGTLIQATPNNNDNTRLDVDLNKTLEDILILGGLEDRVNFSELEKFTQISNSRDYMYSQLDTMFQDASVSAIARILTENVCEVGDNGHIVWAESDDPKISKFVNYVLNTMNVDKNIFGWAFNLVKYGDIYLKNLRNSDFTNTIFNSQSIQNMYSAKSHLNETIQLDLKNANDEFCWRLKLVPDPATMFELNQNDITFGYVETPNDITQLANQDAYAANTGLNSNALNGGGSFNYKVKSNDIILHDAEDYIHIYLSDGQSRFPETIDLIMEPDIKDKNAKNRSNLKSTTYAFDVIRGKSLFYDVYKIWREKTLIESALLLARLTRSSVFRIVSIETANMDRTKANQLLHQVKDMFEQKRAFLSGKNASDYNSPGPIENWIYNNTKNGKGAITVDTVGGDYDPKNLTDLDKWNDRFYGAFGIPKQYFGLTEDGAGFNGGTALTITSTIFQKKVSQVQNALIQGINTAVDLYCIKKGLKSYVHRYTIKMRPPVSQEELNYREKLTNRLNAVSTANALFQDVETKSSRLIILKNLYKMVDYGEDEILQVLDEEIKLAKAAEAEAKKQKEEEAKQAALDAANGEAANAEPANVPGGTGETGGANEASAPEGETASEGDDLNLDLNLTDLPTAESFNNTNPDAVTLNEDVDFLDESEDLPTPEELDDKVDFTKNK